MQGRGFIVRAEDLLRSRDVIVFPKPYRIKDGRRGGQRLGNSQSKPDDEPVSLLIYFTHV